MLDSSPQSFSRRAMTNTKITAFDNKTSLLASAYAYSVGALETALKSRGEAVLLGAGGSTPGPLYQQLSNAGLDWTKITIGLTDERWVPLEHKASNEALMRATLQQNQAALATLLPMVTNADRSPFEEVSAVNAVYSDAAKACDLMILGMGPDAHTLSWFPEAEGLSTALDPQGTEMVTAIQAKQSTVTGEHTARMTLTLPAVAAARHILLLITGNEKRDILETAGPDTPVRHMINAAGDRLSTYWAP